MRSGVGTKFITRPQHQVMEPLRPHERIAERCFSKYLDEVSEYDLASLAFSQTRISHTA